MVSLSESPVLEGPAGPGPSGGTMRAGRPSRYSTKTTVFTFVSSPRLSRSCSIPGLNDHTWHFRNPSSGHFTMLYRTCSACEVCSDTDSTSTEMGVSVL